MKSKLTTALLTLVGALAFNASAHAAGYNVKIKCTNLTDNGVGAAAIDFSAIPGAPDLLLSCLLNEQDSDTVSIPTGVGTVSIEMVATRNVFLTQTNICNVDNFFFLGVPRKFDDSCNVRAGSTQPLNTGARVTITQL